MAGGVERGEVGAGDLGGTDRGGAVGAGVAETLPRFSQLHRAWWVKVLVIFAASRVVTTSILLFYSQVQQVNPWTGARPNYAAFASIWDGNWYYIIAIVGYPAQLPLTPDGHVGESAWAFMPAYPAVVRFFMLVTTLDFPVVAVAVSVAFALAAALMFYKLMTLVLPAGSALFAVVLFCFAPLSPILQVSYAESMHAFLLTAALYLLVTRRYWTLLPVIVVMSLTRPSGLAFALALALHVGYRFWNRRREVFPARERVASLVAAAVSGAMGLAWLLIVWAVTGSFTAYTDTELAWRAPYLGYQELVPFTPWFKAGEFWAGQWGITVPAFTIILVLVIVGFFAALFTPAARRLGVDLRFWIASYALYLLAVFFPQSSTFRLLVPLFPALGVLAQPRSRAYRVSLVVLMIVGQVIWVHIAWFVDGRDWTPP